MVSILRLVFDLYIYVIVIRYLLPFAHMDYYNPIVQMVMKITDPLVKPLRQFLPSIQKVDTASLVVMLLLKIVEIFILLLLAGFSVGLIGVTVWAIGELISAIVSVYFFSIIIQSIISWVNGTPAYITSLLVAFNEPLLEIARRYVPSFNNIDLSPLAVIILLQLINFVVASPIIHVGQALISGQ